MLRCGAFIDGAGIDGQLASCFDLNSACAVGVGAARDDSATYAVIAL